MLYQLTGSAEYKQRFKLFKQTIRDKPQTPNGMTFISQWGSARHAANAAFLFAVDAVWTQKHHGRSKNTAADLKFAKNQIHYILGDGPVLDGRKGSLLIGYGKVYPIKAHHRSSSCRAPPSTCHSSMIDATAPNPWILYGAVIGGPDTATDHFQNDRQNYVTNEVAIDYNCGFQSVLAALLAQK